MSLWVIETNKSEVASVTYGNEFFKELILIFLKHEVVDNELGLVSLIFFVF